MVLSDGCLYGLPSGAPLVFEASAAGELAERSGLARQSGSLAPGESHELALTIDRAGLADGVHRFTVHVEWDRGREELPVQFRVGLRPSPVLWVLARPWEAPDDEPVARTSTTEAEHWEWSLELPAGTYLLLAGSDENANGVVGEEGEHLGSWPGGGAPQPLRVYAQQVVEGVDLDTVVRTSPPQPGPAAFGESCSAATDCESLLCLENTACTASCGPGLACPSSAFCGFAIDDATGAGLDVCREKHLEGERCDDDESCVSGLCFETDSLASCATGCEGDDDCAEGASCGARTDRWGRVIRLCE